MSYTYPYGAAKLDLDLASQPRRDIYDIDGFRSCITHSEPSEHVKIFNVHPIHHTQCKAAP
eukprot:259083-Amorphochlora_amoeboformis.AAC.1